MGYISFRLLTFQVGLLVAQVLKSLAIAKRDFFAILNHDLLRRRTVSI